MPLYMTRTLKAALVVHTADTTVQNIGGSRIAAPLSR